MSDPAMTFIGVSDLAGKLRGRAVPNEDLPERLARGIGWVPTNALITCFDTIGESPYGALGDVVVRPDPSTEVILPGGGDRSAIRLLLGDIHETDGRTWECCTRAHLKAALDRLRALGGFHVHAAFEQEFQFLSMGRAAGDGFTFEGLRAAAGFGEALLAAMPKAGLAPDQFLREHGPNQFEVTVRPARGVAAADQAVVLRALVKEIAAQEGRDVTFAPLTTPGSVGNGVHIHLSVVDDAGSPVLYDPTGPSGLSAVGGSMVAGILDHLGAITALLAPSVISYARLVPHRWSAVFNNLGYRDREAAVRICPVAADDPNAARRFNIEIRAVDAAASPHLALAAIVHAMAQGLEERRPMPEATHEDLSLLDEPALSERGLRRLPTSLPDALAELAASSHVEAWFGGGFRDIYAAHKRAEIAYLQEMSEEAMCAAYARTY